MKPYGKCNIKSREIVLCVFLVLINWQNPVMSQAHWIEVEFSWHPQEEMKNSHVLSMLLVYINYSRFRRDILMIQLG